MANEVKQEIKEFNKNEKKIMRKALEVYKSTVERAKTKSVGEEEMQEIYNQRLAEIAGIYSHSLFKE